MMSPGVFVNAGTEGLASLLSNQFLVYTLYFMVMVRIEMCVREWLIFSPIQERCLSAKHNMDTDEPTNLKLL